MKKIVARVRGGIGNQLFIYAAARRLALINDAELVIDSVTGFAYDLIYKREYQLDHFNIKCRTATFAERMEPFSRVRRAFKRRLNLFSNFENRSYVSQKGMDFDRRLLGIRFKHSLYLEGYWQSENYFKDFESIIRDDLLIKPPVDSVNSRMAERIKKSTAVALHVRLFDNPQSGAINNASGDYYARAVAAIERRLPDAHYFIFSDQPEAARAIVPLPDARLTLVSHNQGDDNAYADLWLMTQCQHFIIANSTFSWWGAWLAAHPTKIVIAPGFESSDGVMSWGFEGLLPMEWIKL